ncbi:Lrp/AsnC family transcriptional regulator [Methylobacterium crusticola]|nr:Lrp/AsnC family transcriptional regulator [Methylobacterium crusticola]
MRKSAVRSNPPPPKQPPAVALDRIDRKILDILQRDSRVTNLDMAERVGLSPAPCSRRVRRLHDDGYISREVAIVDPARVGSTLIAFVSVELDRQREDVLAIFERKMAAQKTVQQCYFISGESDYLLVVACRDMKHYNAFVREVLANEHNIRRFRTSFNLNRVKYDTAIDLEVSLD